MCLAKLRSAWISIQSDKDFHCIKPIATNSDKIGTMSRLTEVLAEPKSEFDVFLSVDLSSAAQVWMHKDKLLKLNLSLSGIIDIKIPWDKICISLYFQVPYKMVNVSDSMRDSVFVAELSHYFVTLWKLLE